MALVLKKDEKIETLVNKLGRDCKKDENENQNKKKLTHPMPTTEQYIKNMLNV
tara:strand:- start:5260 stop:5418 length:159 start_codon:yes stop_codon:yes gene_type:complete